MLRMIRTSKFSSTTLTLVKNADFLVFRILVSPKTDSEPSLIMNNLKSAVDV